MVASAIRRPAETAVTVTDPQEMPKPYEPSAQQMAATVSISP